MPLAWGVLGIGAAGWERMRCVERWHVFLFFFSLCFFACHQLGLQKDWQSQVFSLVLVHVGLMLMCFVWLAVSISCSKGMCNLIARRSIYYKSLVVLGKWPLPSIDGTGFCWILLVYGVEVPWKWSLWSHHVTSLLVWMEYLWFWAAQLEELCREKGKEQDVWFLSGDLQMREQMDCLIPVLCWYVSPL